MLRRPLGSVSLFSMDAPSPTKWKYLGPKPGSAYKQLFIKGTRIMARIIAATCHDEENPRTPEEIAHDFNIPVEAVREAIAYCDSKPPEIEEDWQHEEALIRERILKDPNYYFPGVEKIRAELLEEQRRDSAARK
jgi:uncharacterized protein (DUF433 family)